MITLNKWRLAGNVEAALKSMNMTYIDIAAKTGMKSHSIAQWVTGAAVPSSISLIKLSKATGVSLEKLLEGVAVETD